MKKYFAPEADVFTLAADVIMASVEINTSDNETAKDSIDFIADLVIDGIENI